MFGMQHIRRKRKNMKAVFIQTGKRRKNNLQEQRQQKLKKDIDRNRRRRQTYGLPDQSSHQLLLKKKGRVLQS